MQEVATNTCWWKQKDQPFKVGALAPAGCADIAAGTKNLEFEIRKDFGSLACGEFAPLTGSEVGRKVELSDGDADEAESREVNVGGHFAHLAVAAFVQRQFDPTGGNISPLANGWIARGKVGMD